MLGIPTIIDPWWSISPIRSGGAIIDWRSMFAGKKVPNRRPHQRCRHADAEEKNNEPETTKELLFAEQEMKHGPTDQPREQSQRFLSGIGADPIRSRHPDFADVVDSCRERLRHLAGERSDAQSEHPNHGCKTRCNRDTVGNWRGFGQLSFHYGGQMDLSLVTAAPKPKASTK
jgi:hypothetical protein